MIIDVHSHVWEYPEHFDEDTGPARQRARADREVDLTVTYEGYRATAREDVRTIVFGGKARLSGLWVDDRYVADQVREHPDLVGHSVTPSELPKAQSPSMRPSRYRDSRRPIMSSP